MRIVLFDKRISTSKLSCINCSQHSFERINLHDCNLMTSSEITIWGKITQIVCLNTRWCDFLSCKQKHLHGYKISIYKPVKGPGTLRKCHATLTCFIPGDGLFPKHMLGALTFGLVSKSPTSSPFGDVGFSYCLFLSGS